MRPPYWAHVWGGGLAALARFVLDRPETARGRRVVDPWTGSGVVAVAAATAGATRVAAVDLDSLALAATRLNAALNGVPVERVYADALDGPTPDADLVLAGDLFYEPALAARAGAFLTRYARVGDPGRASFAAAVFPGARLRWRSDTDGADFSGRGLSRVYEVVV